MTLDNRIIIVSFNIVNSATNTVVSVQLSFEFSISGLLNAEIQSQVINNNIRLLIYE